MKTTKSNFGLSLMLLIFLAAILLFKLNSQPRTNNAAPQAIKLTEKNQFLASKVASSEGPLQTNISNHSVSEQKISNREELIALATAAKSGDIFALATTPILSANGYPILEHGNVYKLTKVALKRAQYRIYLNYPRIAKGDPAPRIQLVGNNTYDWLTSSVTDDLLQIQLPESSKDNRWIIQVDYYPTKALPKSRYLLQVE